MNTLALKPIERTYKNNGQHLEQMFRFTLTGELAKADNLPATAGADCLGYQIKSARATLCKGRDLRAAMKNDKATAYAYVTKDGLAYLMNRDEYLEFGNEFGTLTRESDKNGGAEKIRLGHETKKLLDWLSERVGR